MLNSKLARNVERDNRWAWLDGTPDPETCGESLHALTNREIRMLGKSTVKLYKHLERMRGWEAQWFKTELKTVALSIGMSYATAKRALKKLRDVGAVQTQFSHTFWRLMADGSTSGMIRSTSWRIWGSWETRKGITKILLPREKFINWVGENASKSSHGGRRNGAGRKNQVEPLGSKDPNVSRGLSDQVEPSFLITNINITNNITNVMQPSCVAPQGMFLRLAEDDEIGNPNIDTLAGGPRLQPRQNLLKIPERSRLPRTVNPAMEIQGDMPAKQQVQLIVAAYRSAVYKVHGVESKSFIYGDITKSKHFPRLKKIAATLDKFAVPPGPWAEWYLLKLQEWASKDRGGPSRWGSKTPPWTVVFSMKAIEKRSGWFSKEFDRPIGWTAQPTKAHLEQELRIREIQRLNRGFSGENALTGLPDWYASLRRSEIKAGYTDPNEFYPQLK